MATIRSQPRWVDGGHRHDRTAKRSGEFSREQSVDDRYPTDLVAVDVRRQPKDRAIFCALRDDDRQRIGAACGQCRPVKRAITERSGYRIAGPDSKSRTGQDLPPCQGPIQRTTATCSSSISTLTTPDGNRILVGSPSRSRTVSCERSTRSPWREVSRKTSVLPSTPM